MCKELTKLKNNIEDVDGGENKKICNTRNNLKSEYEDHEWKKTKI